MDSSFRTNLNSPFCVPYPVDLAFTTKPPGQKKRCHLAAVDADGKVVFQTKYSLRYSKTCLQDEGGHILLTMKTKVSSSQDKWQAFSGDSTEEKDLVFDMIRSSKKPCENVWLVYLAANTKEENCDFKIIGSYSKKTYAFYQGDSSLIVAQVTKEHKLKLPTKNIIFGATISENLDYSIVAGMMTILHVVNGIDVSTSMMLMGFMIGSSSSIM